MFFYQHKWRLQFDTDVQYFALCSSRYRGSGAACAWRAEAEAALQTEAMRFLDQKQTKSFCSRFKKYIYIYIYIYHPPPTINYSGHSMYMFPLRFVWTWNSPTASSFPISKTKWIHLGLLSQLGGHKAFCCERTTTSGETIRCDRTEAARGAGALPSTSLCLFTVVLLMPRIDYADHLLMLKKKMIFKASSRRPRRCERTFGEMEEGRRGH